MACSQCLKKITDGNWNGIRNENAQYINFCSWDCRWKYLRENNVKNYDYVLKGDPNFKQNIKKNNQK